MKSKKDSEFWVVLENGEGRKIDQRSIDSNVGSIGYMELPEGVDFSKKSTRDEYSKKIRNRYRLPKGHVCDLT